MFNHETLPIGEFPHSTNTTAYMVAKSTMWFTSFLFLLLKNGIHFAVGDTYSFEEDIKTYNP